MDIKSTVFIIAPYFPPNRSAAANRLYYLAKIFYENNFNVYILTTNALIEINDNQISDLDKSRIFNQNQEGSELSRFIGTTFVKGIIGNILRFIKENIFFDIIDPISLILLTKLINRKTIKLISNMKNTDIIISSSPPFLIHIIALILSKFNQVNHLVDFRDQWALHPAKKSNRFVNYIKIKLENFVIKNSTACFTVSKGIAQEFCEEYSHKFNIAFNSVDLEEVKNAFNLAKSLNNFCDNTEINNLFSTNKNKMIITYPGSLPPKFYDLDKFLLNINNLGDFIENFIFLFVGDNELLKLKVRNDFPHLKKHFLFYPRIPHTSALITCIKSDFCLCFSMEGSVDAKGLLTSKIWEYIVIDAKIITFNLPEVCEVKDLLAQHEIMNISLENTEKILQLSKNRNIDYNFKKIELLLQKLSYKNNLLMFIEIANQVQQ